MDKKNYKNLDMMTKLLLKIEKQFKKILDTDMFSEDNSNNMAEFIGGMIDMIDAIGDAIGAVRDFISPVTNRNRSAFWPGGRRPESLWWYSGCHANDWCTLKAFKDGI